MIEINWCQVHQFRGGPNGCRAPELSGFDDVPCHMVELMAFPKDQVGEQESHGTQRCWHEPADLVGSMRRYVTEWEPL